jgi:hypothetical protein
LGISGRWRQRGHWSTEWTANNAARIVVAGTKETIIKNGGSVLPHQQR